MRLRPCPPSASPSAVPVSLPPALKAPSGFGRSSEVSAEQLSPCAGRRADLPRRSSSWHPFPEGCGAALAPDLRSSHQPCSATPPSWWLGVPVGVQFVVSFLDAGMGPDLFFYVSFISILALTWLVSLKILPLGVPAHCGLVLQGIFPDSLLNLLTLSSVLPFTLLWGYPVNTACDRLFLSC